MHIIDSAFIEEAPKLQASEGKIPSSDEIKMWFKRFVSFSRSLNLPTERAWKTFLSLHGTDV